jgi:hypothetical protein
MYKFIINEEAFFEIENAFDYYAEVGGMMLANKFNEELNEAYHIITSNPNFQIRSGKFRGFPLQKFPYILFFEITESKKEIKLLSVFNTYQNHKTWPK